MEQKPPEVGQKARELEEAARAQTQRKLDEGKVKVNGAMVSAFTLLEDTNSDSMSFGV